MTTTLVKLTSVALNTDENYDVAQATAQTELDAFVGKTFDVSGQLQEHWEHWRPSTAQDRLKAAVADTLTDLTGFSVAEVEFERPPLTDEQKSAVAREFADYQHSLYYFQFDVLAEVLDPDCRGDQDSLEEWCDYYNAEAPEGFDWAALDYETKEDLSGTELLLTLTYSKDPELDLGFALETGSDTHDCWKDTAGNALSSVTGEAYYCGLTYEHGCEQVGHNQWRLSTQLYFAEPTK